MESLVRTKTRVLTKALPTLITLIRLLPGVYSVVANEAAFATEGFAAIFTLVRGFFSVHLLVLKEVWALTEGFPTLTLIGPVHQVRSVVKGQVGAMAESLPTFGAHIWFLPSVCSPVFSKVGATTKGLPTFSTYVTSLSWGRFNHYFSTFSRTFVPLSFSGFTHCLSNLASHLSAIIMGSVSLLNPSAWDSSELPSLSVDSSFWVFNLRSQTFLSTGVNFSSFTSLLDVEGPPRLVSVTGLHRL